jgi:hypothetical protein
MKLLGATKVDAGKTGVGRWVQELGKDSVHHLRVNRAN